MGMGPPKSKYAGVAMLMASNASPVPVETVLAWFQRAPTTAPRTPVKSLAQQLADTARAEAEEVGSDDPLPRSLLHI